MNNFKIIATGSYLPKRIVSNEELSKTLDTTDEWIFSRSGIKNRHIAAADEQTSDMATEAIGRALKVANLAANDLDCIILATTTPDKNFPATACLVQKNIGMQNGFAFDIQAVCSGFVFALELANGLFSNKKIKRIAIIGSDKMSKLIDWQDRSTSVLFGDGAGAVIFERTEEAKGVIASSIHSDGTFEHILESVGTSITMNGREVFKLAVEKMVNSLENALEEAAIGVDEIDYLIPHQANIRILNMVANKLSFPQEKLIATIADHANTSAATIPLALDQLAKTTTLNNKTIAFTAAGAGFTWGSIIFKN